MKTDTIPYLRVDPDLRRSAESVLREGESLSGFVHQAIRQAIAFRQAQQDFIARGLIARNQARHTTSYVEASAVVDRLQGMLDKAKAGNEVPG
jgi:predicted transcriptional regulator